MRGRICSCLLVVLSFAIPASLWGQAERSDLAQRLGLRSERDSAQDLPLAAPYSRLPSELEGTSRLGAPRPFPTPPVRFPGTTSLSQIARAAGTIFSGRVTSIRRARTNSPVQTLAITFHVERAIRGVFPGQNLTIRQWIGLWASGQRYRVGEHVLLLLYPPSKLGLTSSVAGPMGRFRIDSSGRIVLSGEHLAAFQADPILGGKSRARFADFIHAVSRARNEADE